MSSSQQRRSAPGRVPPRPAAPPRAGLPRAAVGAVVAVAVVLVGALVILSQTLSFSRPPAAPTPAVPEQGRVRGSPSAPITMIEYSDFQCPFCGRWSRDTAPRVEEEYVARGLLRREFRYYAFLGQESFRAAEAAECANDQGLFWPYHDKLFNSQRGENQGAFSDANLKAFARELRLDTARFDACLDGNLHSKLVVEETEAAKKQGISSTPTFIINGEVVKGALPFDQFKLRLDRWLTPAPGTQ